MVDLNLQLFGESGGDGGAGASGAGGTPNATNQTATGEDGAAAALEQYRQKRIASGKKTVAPAPSAVATPKQAGETVKQEEEPAAQHPASAEPQDKTKAFEDLIKGDYKDEFDKRVQNIVKERLKNSKESVETLNKLAPMLEMMYSQRGITTGDVDSLVKSYINDDSLYEAEALERGIPVNALKEIKTLQRETEEYRKQQEASAEQERYEAHFRTLVQQAEQARVVYPSLDLRAELANPDFLRLTSPGVGVDVRTAYEVVHRDQIQPAMAAAIAQKTAANVASTIRSGGKRPSENGVSGQASPVGLSDDPRNWSRAERNRIVAEVKAGKHIRL